MTRLALSPKVVKMGISTTQAERLWAFALSFSIITVVLRNLATFGLKKTHKRLSGLSDLEPATPKPVSSYSELASCKIYFCNESNPKTNMSTALPALPSLCFILVANSCSYRCVFESHYKISLPSVVISS